MLASSTKVPPSLADQSRAVWQQLRQNTQRLAELNSFGSHYLATARVLSGGSENPKNGTGTKSNVGPKFFPLRQVVARGSRATDGIIDDPSTTEEQLTSSSSVDLHQRTLSPSCQTPPTPSAEHLLPPPDASRSPTVWGRPTRMPPPGGPPPPLAIPPPPQRIAEYRRLEWDHS